MPFSAERVPGHLRADLSTPMNLKEPDAAPEDEVNGINKTARRFDRLIHGPQGVVR